MFVFLSDILLSAEELRGCSSRLNTKRTYKMRWCTWLHQGDNDLISGSQTLVADSGASPVLSSEAVARCSLLLP